jgi:hypothetical protein
MIVRRVLSQQNGAIAKGLVGLLTSSQKRTFSIRKRCLRISILRTSPLFEFSKVHRLFLLPHDGNRAGCVTDYRVRDAAHKRPPYPSVPPAAHHYQPGTYAVGQVHYLFVRPAQP